MPAPCVEGVVADGDAFVIGPPDLGRIGVTNRDGTLVEVGFVKTCSRLLSMSCSTVSDIRTPLGGSSRTLQCATPDRRFMFYTRTRRGNGYGYSTSSLSTR